MRIVSWFLALLLAVAIPAVICMSALANGTGIGEVGKYFNPFQKTGYLNQSQDRVIKKKSFKLKTAIEGAVCNRELGLFVAVPGDKLADKQFAEQLLANPQINGLSVIIPWSQLEPKEDEYDWHLLDDLLALCHQANKTLILNVSACGESPTPASADIWQNDCPQWVSDGIKSVTFTSPDGKSHKMPLFWDKVYLARWNNLVRELAGKYDGNPDLHSVGITGGGFRAGTSVLPDYPARVPASDGKEEVDLLQALKRDYGLSQRQLVEHWKYTADLFPKRFQKSRLNFALNPPLPKRQGEDALDEISDYLVFRYGERVYLTRQGIDSARHGFDDYRLLSKFHGDTLLGMQITDKVKVEDLAQIGKHALDDGISFAEIPPSLCSAGADKNVAVQQALQSLYDHLGFQIVNQKRTIADNVPAGDLLKASFEFVNVGAAPAMKPERNFDKDTPGSYRILVELRDEKGKAIFQNVHTPPIPTNQWKPGQVVTWEKDLKTADGDKRILPPGKYTAWMSLIDPDGQRKIHFLDATTAAKPKPADAVEIGVIVVGLAGDTKPIETSAITGERETSR